MKLFEFAVHLEPDPGGGFVVTCRDLPELITQGDDLEHALSEATDALDEVVALYRSDGIPIPSPSDRRTGEYWVAVLPGATTGTPMR